MLTVWGGRNAEYERYLGYRLWLVLLESEYFYAGQCNMGAQDANSLPSDMSSNVSLMPRRSKALLVY